MNSIIFEITPIGKPRMVRSDSWKKRPVVLNYWEYKDNLKEQAEKFSYTISEKLENITFVLPMPDSWSKKKKEQMDGQPHKNKPDLDNIIKGFKDCLCDNDSFVHTYNNIRKVWGYSGKITINH
jgi:Holliday junction resolvase RusA-like endonuclease